MKKKKKSSKRVFRKRVVAAMVVRIPDFKKCGGLVPVIVVDKKTGSVLMLAYTRVKEFRETFHEHQAVFYSRSRKKRWKKGEEKSGNVLLVHSMYLDCDGDTLLYVVSQKNPDAGVCHTGSPTCFSPIISAVLEQKGNTTFKVVPLG